MNPGKIPIIMAAIAIVVMPLAVRAQQISPNPNNGNITVDGHGAFNDSKPFNNKHIIEIEDTGTLTNDSGGWLDNYGKVNIDPGGTLKNSGTLDNSGTLKNSGSVNGSGLYNGQGGVVNNYSGATLKNSGALNNSGVLKNSGAISGTGTYTQTAGQTTDNGSLSQKSVNIKGGTLSGDGTITGNVNIGSEAKVEPGSSSTTGKLTINGNLTSKGDYTFKIGGKHGCGYYDMLQINGNAYFSGGSIDIDFMNSYKAVAGDCWDFLLAGSITGWNTLSFNVTGLGKGLGWEIERTAKGEELLIKSSSGGAETPIPSTVFLLAAGLAGLIGVKKLCFG